MSWYFAGVARGLADTHDALATMNFDAVDAPADAGAAAPPRVASLLDRDAAMHGATADYWRGRYDAPAGGGERAAAGGDARLLQFAANGAFRKMQRAAGGKPPAADQLDQVLQGYAAVLKQDGFNRDAAFNYEYVARLRDQPPRAKPQPPSPPSTIHGRQGAHPPRTKGEEFEILTPMDYGDREAQPEPTPGKKLPRKG
jgi:hypothetical protein